MNKINPQSAIRNPKFCGGFTLIELTAVIVIISIVYLISAPLFRSFQTTALLKNTSKSIAFYLEQAKSLAATYNRDFTVNFDLTNQKLSIADSLITPSGDDTIQRIKDYLIPQQIILSTKTSFTQLTFSSTGTISLARTIYIQKKNTNRYYTITTQTTGTIRVYNHYHDSSPCPICGK